MYVFCLAISLKLKKSRQRGLGFFFLCFKKFRENLREIWGNLFAFCYDIFFFLLINVALLIYPMLIYLINVTSILFYFFILNFYLSIFVMYYMMCRN